MRLVSEDKTVIAAAMKEAEQRGEEVLVLSSIEETVTGERPLNRKQRRRRAAWARKQRMPVA